jgi:hypothetical protein
MVEQQSIIKPDPDPTTLTTQQVQREILSVRQLMETRIDAMDTAIKLVQATTDRFREKDPLLIEAAITKLQELQEEKFKGIQTQFAERDTRAEQTAKEGKVSIDAALAAAKEAGSEQNKSNTQAINKSETATTKQLELIGVTISAMVKSFDDKINDIKDRISNIERNSNGMVQHSRGLADGWGYIVGAIGLLIAIVTVVLLALKR